MSNFNPVQMVALDLAKKYGKFTMDKAQFLVWETDKDTLDLVQAMLTTHTEQVALVSDLTLPANVPFNNSDTFEYELAYALIQDIVASQNDDDLDPEFRKWDVKSHLKAEHPLVSLLEDMSFRVREIARHVTLYFHPFLISDKEEFAVWIEKIFESTKSSLVQYLYFDIQDEGIGRELKNKFKDRVMIFDDRVNTSALMRETLLHEQKDQPDTPEKAFRTHIVGGITSLRENNVEKGHCEILKALEIAKENNWPDMQMTALITYANSMIGKGNYKKILQVASEALEIGEANRDHASKVVIENLILQAQFAIASAHTIEKKWQKGMVSYQLAAAEAEQICNKILEFEARRMAVFCAMKVSDYEAAWDVGFPGLLFVQDYPEELKTKGTVPLMMKQMYSASKHKSQWSKDFEEHAKVIYGANWKNYA